MIIHFQSTISLKSIDSVKISIKNISLTSTYFIRACLTSRSNAANVRMMITRKMNKKKTTCCCVFTDLYLDRIKVHKEQQ